MSHRAIGSPLDEIGGFCATKDQHNGMGIGDHKGTCLGYEGVHSLQQARASEYTEPVLPFKAVLSPDMNDDINASMRPMDSSGCRQSYPQKREPIHHEASKQHLDAIADVLDGVHEKCTRAAIA